MSYVSLVVQKPGLEASCIFYSRKGSEPFFVQNVESRFNFSLDALMSL